MLRTGTHRLPSALSSLSRRQHGLDAPRKLRLGRWRPVLQQHLRLCQHVRRLRLRSGSGRSQHEQPKGLQASRRSLHCLQLRQVLLQRE